MQRVTIAAFLPLIALIAVTAAGQGTNSFEGGLGGWTVVPAGNATIRTAATAEALFPSQGDQYCELDSTGSSAATPGVPTLPYSEMNESSAATLVQAVSAARLLGATAEIVGVSPKIAQLLVAQDMAFAGIRTHATLRAGLRQALARLG